MLHLRREDQCADQECGGEAELQRHQRLSHTGRRLAAAGCARGGEDGGRPIGRDSQSRIETCGKPDDDGQHDERRDHESVGNCEAQATGCIDERECNFGQDEADETGECRIQHCLCQQLSDDRAACRSADLADGNLTGPQDGPCGGEVHVVDHGDEQGQHADYAKRHDSHTEACGRLAFGRQVTLRQRLQPQAHYVGGIAAEVVYGAAFHQLRHGILEHGDVFGVPHSNEGLHLARTPIVPDFVRRIFR